jgi:uncharacterized protein YodC (DUF2158 family)
MELVEEPKYKHGDFLMSPGRLAFIFDREGENGEAHHLFCTDMGGSIKDNAQDRWRWIRHCGYLKDAIAADQEAIKIIHDGLKSIGKRWNSEKKCVEDIPKRKFKAGDKVTLKSGCTSNPGLTYYSPFDEYIGKELIVIDYTESGNVKCNNGLRFAEDWLEPWSDEPKVGDWVIFWDYIEVAKVGMLTDIRPDELDKYVVDHLTGWNHAVKWDGTVDHLQKIRSGKV